MRYAEDPELVASKRKALSFALALLCLFSADDAFARKDRSQGRLPATKGELCYADFRAILAQSKLSRLPRISRIRHGDIVMDANIALRIERTQRQGVAPQEFHHALQRLARIRGVTPENFLTAPPTTSRLYYTPSVIEEVMPERVKKQDLSFIKGSRIFRRNLSLNSEKYRRIIKILEAARVGGPKGEHDRKIITEVLFAETEPGAIPIFATADRGIYKKLCTFSLECKRFSSHQDYEKNFPDGFLVTIEGRNMIVLPLSIGN